MPIGEFAGAAAAPEQDGLMLATPMYWFYEMSRASLNPARAFAEATRLFYKNPINPLSQTDFGKSVAAAAEVFERATRRYAKPAWDIDSTLVGGERVPVEIETIWEKPFCRLLHFKRAFTHPLKQPATETADRRAAVRPLCDLAAWHGRSLPAAA